jgi:DNA relaxase NicK
MSRRAEWRKVLDSEVERWSALSCAQLVSELRDLQAYEVEFDSKSYQVEVQLLENTEQYFMVAVDDGSLPASIAPVSRSVIRQKALPKT